MIEMRRRGKTKLKEKEERNEEMRQNENRKGKNLAWKEKTEIEKSRQEGRAE